MPTRFTLYIFFLLSFCTAITQAQENSDAISTDTTLAVSLLLEADSLIGAKNLDLAKLKALEAKSIYSSTLGEGSLESVNTWYLLGEISYQSRNYDEAKMAWDTTLILQQKTLGENDIRIAQTYYGLAKIENVKRNYSQAITLYEKALNIRLLLANETFAELGDIYRRIANCYRYQNKFDKAVGIYQESLRMFSSLEDADTRKKRISSVKHLIGFTYMRKGSFDEAIYWFEQALELRIELYSAEHIYVAASYNDIGECLLSKGQYERAIEYINKSADIIIAKGGEQNENLIFPYHLLARSYIKLGDYETALHHINNTIAIPLDPTGSYIKERPNFYSIKGLCLAQLERYDNAIELYNNIIAESTKNKPDGTVHTGIYYSQLADYYTEQGDFEKAISLHQEALRILEVHLEGQKHQNFASVLYRIGKCYQQQKLFTEAIDYFNQAKEANSFSEDYEGIISLSIQLKIALTSGDTHFQAYENNKELSSLHASLSDYQYGIGLYEFQRRNLIYGKERIGERIWPVYEDAINNTLLFGELAATNIDEDVFLYMEKSKSLSLFESIQASKALKFAAIPAELLETEAFLKIDINTHEKKLKNYLSKGHLDTDSIVASLRSDIFELNRAYESTISRMESEYPDYFQAKHKLSTVGIQQIQQQLLDKDQSLLEYFVGDSTIYLYLIQRDYHQIVQIKKDFPLEDWVQQLRNGIYGPFAPQNTTISLQEATQQYISSAQKLYQHLLAPVADQLTESLIIVPDGVLGYVPFEMLLSAEVTDFRNFGSYPYLLKKYAISYSYSATLLQEMQQRQHLHPPKEKLLAMAPFYQKGYESIEDIMSQQIVSESSGTGGVVQRSSFGPLPSSGVEAGEIANIWGGDYFLGADATENRFNEIAGQYRILHLSTHGQADNRSGDYSFLAFAELTDSIENELLYVRDLYNLQLNADLVVLSACETAIGELQKGEGIISLTRAFTYAGAKSILTTLWVADDNATKDLMISFHSLLKNGYTKDNALRQAKIKYIEAHPGRNSHPFFWGSFIPVGDMSPLGSE